MNGKLGKSEANVVLVDGKRKKADGRGTGVCYITAAWVRTA